MRVLIVDDDLAFANLMERLLTSEGFTVNKLIDPVKALKEVATNKYDLVLVDYKMPDLDGLELLERIKSHDPSLPVILVTNYSDLRVAVRSVKLGAFDFVTKPIIPDEFLTVVKRALSDSLTNIEKVQDNKHVRKESDYIVGSCQKAKDVWDYSCQLAPTGLNVLISGESGTGKEYIAQALHSMSRRDKHPFIAVDCGTISSELAVSSFFGHVKGAFTGANSDKVGFFEQANKGTLFLDEVGNLAIEAQAAILRAIQERSFKRLGASHELNVDVRVIAATNEPLATNVSKGAFRGDLYYRLNEFELHIPPLRERMDDLEVFVTAFLKQSESEFNKENITIQQEVLQAFKRYSWPGNIRELRNIIRRASLLAKNGIITLNEIPEGISNPINESLYTPAPRTVKDSTSFDIKEESKELERELIIAALEKSKYNKTQAAKTLNIDRSTLYAKLKIYGIED